MSFLNQIKEKKILVIGDLMLDCYVRGSVNRISPEAPVPVLEVTSEELLIGGAGNVVSNLIAVGVQASVLGAVGNDEGGRKLLHLLDDLGANTDLIEMSSQRMTTIKTRVVAGQQQIVRVDRELKTPLGSDSAGRFLVYMEEIWDQFDAVILSDYGKGTLTHDFVDGIRRIHKKRPKIISVDPKEKDFSKYRDFTVCTPNQAEAELACGLSLDTEEKILEHGQKLRKYANLDCLLMTLGKNGMGVFDSEGSVRIPAQAKEVFDVTGAGDTVISVLTIGLCCGFGFEKAARLANLAAGIVVGKSGVATVTKGELEWISNHSD